MSRTSALKPMLRRAGRWFLSLSLAFAWVAGMWVAGGWHGQVAQALVGASCDSELKHLSWVWQFSRDGFPASIASTLNNNNLGVIVKTHDGTDWMAQYDTSPDAVSGPEQVRRLAQHFEGQGVPFHAWAVVQGLDPVKEAEMVAQVLAAGARSIVIDLEPWAGFWRGTPQSAVVFGRELRRLQPNATIIVAVDPRPWVLSRIPLSEFASFSNALAPLVYWESFNSPANLQGYRDSGFPPGPEGITPEFVLDVSASVLAPYNLPLQPVGQGDSGDANVWIRFVDHAIDKGMPIVSVWRHGVADPQVWGILKERSPCDFLVSSFQPFPGYGLQAGSFLGSDFNGDGKDDLLHLTNGDYVHPWLSHGDGTFGVSTFRPWPGYPIQSGQWLDGDFDGDGKTDLIHLTNGDYVHPWLSNGDGTFAIGFFRPWEGYPIQSGRWLAGDFNGDGRDDLLHLTDADYAHPWLSNGDGTFAIGFFRPWPGYGMKLGRFLSGDFNGDGKDDLLHLTNGDYVHPWLSNGDGTFGVSTFRPWPGYPIQSGQWLDGDFDGDGKTDLLNVTDGDYVHPWLSKGDGTFTIGFFRPWPGYEMKLGRFVAGDFNGDGKADLVHLTNADYAHPWRSRGDGTFTVGFFRPWRDYGMQAGRFLAGDFNGDGKDDLLHLVGDYANPWRSLMR